MNIEVAHPFPNLTNWKCAFPVVERSASWTDKYENPHKVEKQKALVGLRNGAAHFLAYVGHKYHLLTNIEVFHYIFNKLAEILSPEQLELVEVKEHIDYGGRDTYIEIRFPNIRCDISGRGDVAFRMIFGNSYGGKSVTCVSGAIDFFCTNGMITGAFETRARRHTSGFTLAGIDGWIIDSINEFTSFNDRLKVYANTHITMGGTNALCEHLASNGYISKTFAKELPERIFAESTARGGNNIMPTVWDVYSAMTTFATHDKIRDTGNDHEFSTRMKRMRDADTVTRAAYAWVVRPSNSTDI